MPGLETPISKCLKGVKCLILRILRIPAMLEAKSLNMQSIKILRTNFPEIAMSSLTHVVPYVTGFFLWANCRDNLESSTSSAKENSLQRRWRTLPVNSTNSQFPFMGDGRGSMKNDLWLPFTDDVELLRRSLTFYFFYCSILSYKW